MSADPELLTIGRAIRRERRARALSQEELADASGLHRNYVGGIERGERNAGLKAVLALAKALNVSASVFFAAGNGDR